MRNKPKSHFTCFHVSATAVSVKVQKRRKIFSSNLRESLCGQVGQGRVPQSNILFSTTYRNIFTDNL